MRPAPSLVRAAARPRARPAPSLRPRFASSGPNPTVDAAQKKAQDALAAAQGTAASLWARAQAALGPLGERAGSLLGAYREPLTYRLAVAREVLKHVYVAEGLQPPRTRAALAAAYRSIWDQAASPAFWRGAAGRGELARVGVYALEAYGIFKIGEIVGRGSLVGYNLH